MPKKSKSQKDSTIEVTPKILLKEPWRVKSVKALPGFCINVIFLDGTQGKVLMKQFIMSPNAGVFKNLQDEKLFNSVYLEYGAVMWPGEIDLAPDAMYDAIKKDGIWVLC
jgi:hypothetical protein